MHYKIFTPERPGVNSIRSYGAWHHCWPAQAPLAAFGSALGIAFQIQDDILDATGDDQALGKRSGADARQSKSTYVSLLGIDRAQDALQRMLEQSRQSLDDVNLLTPSFDQLIHFVAHRDY